MGAGDTKIMSNTETIRMISVMEDSRAKKNKKSRSVHACSEEAYIV